MMLVADVLERHRITMTAEQQLFGINRLNASGGPIVCTPEDAFRCFMGTEVESLAVGSCYLEKDGQDPGLKQNYESKFELD
jgi:hypothetical protein